MHSTERNRVFISYSHKDVRLFEELYTMLKPAVREGLLDVWSDRMIAPGTHWQVEIARALASARVAVLLVSANFLASDFIATHELPPLLTEARKGGLRILWVLLSNCLYENTPIADYQATHDLSKPIDQLRKHERSALLFNICRELVGTTASTVSDQIPSYPKRAPTRSELENMLAALTDRPDMPPAHAGAVAAQPQPTRPAPESRVRAPVIASESQPQHPVMPRPRIVPTPLLRTNVPASQPQRSGIRYSHVPSQFGAAGSEEELLSLLSDGYKAVLVCGNTNAGKSELVRGFTRANTLIRGRAQFEVQSDPVGATSPDQVWYQVLAGGERRVFIDPSGELFRRLAPSERHRLQLPDLTPLDFEFLTSLIIHMDAVVLVFDLTHSVYTNLDQRQESWHSQEEDCHFLLALLRWLRFRRDTPANFSTAAILARTTMLPRLDLPVMVAFTKADLLASLAIEQPLALARLRLPLLHSALRTHVHRFRYDFCHTMVRREDGDQPVSPPVGVLLALEWLIHPPLRWMPRVASGLLGG